MKLLARSLSFPIRSIAEGDDPVISENARFCIA